MLFEMSLLITHYTLSHYMLHAVMSVDTMESKSDMNISHCTLE